MSGVDFVMTDHPAWNAAGNGGGKLRVFVSVDGGRCLVRTCGPAAFTVEQLAPPAWTPVHDVFRLPPDALTQLPQLAQSLAGLGTFARFRAGNLWEALGAAVVRQMLHGAPGDRLYRQFCRSHGQRVPLPAGEDYWLFPTPETVLGLTCEQFAAARLAAKRVLLRDAASTYLRDGHGWHDLPPLRLVEQLRRIPGVGRWTAHAAVADWSNDWALYPAGDRTLRMCARRAAPAVHWPTHDERAFANVWRLHTGTRLGLVTVLALAWGNRHADRSG